MQWIAVLLVLMAGIFALQWHTGRRARIADELAGLTATAADLPRKLALKRETGRARLDRVEDPREAASILMLNLAQANGPVSAVCKATIHDIILSEFQLTDADADALITHAGWLLRGAQEAGEVMRDMTVRILESPGIGAKEIIDLDGMLVAVSESEGRPSEDQLVLLQVFRDVSGVRT
jgi:uncharacterized tellurite resistance protein B-like protein